MNKISTGLKNDVIGVLKDLRKSHHGLKKIPRNGNLSNGDQKRPLSTMKRFHETARKS